MILRLKNIVLVPKKTNLYRKQLSEELKGELFADYMAFIKPIGKNLRALRIYTGISNESLVEVLMMKYNFQTSSKTLSVIENNKTGDYKPISFIYIALLAKYWGITTNQLFTIDYSIEDNLPDHIKARKKYNRALVSSHVLTFGNKFNIPLLSSFPSIPIQS